MVRLNGKYSKEVPSEKLFARFEAIPEGVMATIIGSSALGTKSVWVDTDTSATKSLFEFFGNDPIEDLNTVGSCAMENLMDFIYGQAASDVKKTKPGCEH